MHDTIEKQEDFHGREKHFSVMSEEEKTFSLLSSFRFDSRVDADAIRNENQEERNEMYFDRRSPLI